jgi:DNA-binding GntR family transcriptional regulator
VAVTRSVLRDQIRDALVARILDGTYAPGERIVEIRVAQEFGVSQAPVR